MRAMIVREVVLSLRCLNSALGGKARVGGSLKELAWCAACWKLHRIPSGTARRFGSDARGGGVCPSLPPLPAQTEPPPVAGLVTEQRQTTTGYALGAGDVLRVSVYDHPDLSQEVTIEADGSFHYPLIGRVQAASLRVRRWKRSLVQRLANGYLVSPQVGVTVTQHKSQQVYVMGAVKAPGAYPLRRQATLLEMLSAAGGPAPEAGLEVMLVRATDAQALPSDIAQACCGVSRAVLHARAARTIAGGRGVTAYSPARWGRDLCAGRRICLCHRRDPASWSVSFGARYDRS